LIMNQINYLQGETMPRYKPGTIKSGPLQGIPYDEFNFVIEYVKDFNPRRAAVACGMEPEKGYAYRKKPNVVKAIEAVLAKRLEASDIDAEWVLMEAVDNVLIARQKGQIAASNSALQLVAKHCMVDAFAADKVKIDTADDVVERLKRARKRTEQAQDDEQPSFL